MGCDAPAPPPTEEDDGCGEEEDWGTSGCDWELPSLDTPYDTQTHTEHCEWYITTVMILWWFIRPRRLDCMFSWHSLQSLSITSINIIPASCCPLNFYSFPVPQTFVFIFALFLFLNTSGYVAARKCQLPHYLLDHLCTERRLVLHNCLCFLYLTFFVSEHILNISSGHVHKERARLPLADSICGEISVD